MLGEEEIAFIVSRWTGIPVTRLQEAETARLLRMEEEMHETVVGQDEAIKALARSIRRSRAGLKDPKRPIGSFIFCGPTGVGKTELARALARFLFADAHALIRVDMCEYMEKFSVSRLIGAPPGYVGYEDSGTLTKAVRRKPYSVVLLDEIEKAHPDVFNILLQVLDEGHLTDNYGRVIDFKNTVVIMTSNVGRQGHRQGQDARVRQPATRRPDFDRIAEKVKEEINHMFNPEFLNRLDDVIVFHPLTREHISLIVAILLRDVQKRLARGGAHAQPHGAGHGLPGEARVRRELRRAPAQARHPAVHRGSAVGEDPARRVREGRRDRSRRGPGRNSWSSACSPLEGVTRSLVGACVIGARFFSAVPSPSQVSVFRPDSIAVVGVGAPTPGAPWPIAGSSP